jgi:siderophore synthetase component
VVDDFPIQSTRTLYTPYGEQDENGTDLSLIRELLRLTPLERLRRGDAATTDMLRLRNQARRIEYSAELIINRIEMGGIA